MGKLQTAEWLERERGISKDRAYELARRNILPHVRLGRQVRFVPEQIDAWIEAGGQALPGGWRQEPNEKIVS